MAGNNANNNGKKVNNTINNIRTKSLQSVGVPKFVANQSLKESGLSTNPASLPSTKKNNENVKNELTGNSDSEINQESLTDEELQSNDLNESDNSLASEEPTDNEENANNNKNESTADIPKNILPLLLKSPIFWIVVLVLVVIFGFLAIFFITTDYDWKGIGNDLPQFYPMVCDGVYLTWENEDYIEEKTKEGTYSPMTDPYAVNLKDTGRYSYKKYDFDTYVGGIVWTDNNKAQDVENDIVYQAMAVAARTRVVMSLGQNCVVLRDYNPENFTELTGKEKKYSEITKAVSDTAGMIIGKDGSLLNALYDTFSYISKYKEDDANYQNRGTYYLMNKNETGSQTVPSDWVEENGVPTKKTLTSTYLSSFSLYGAKYLLEKQDSQYDLKRILEYYYGRDIIYYTIDYAFSNSYSVDCSDISMKNTSLSKEEFIARVNAYNKPAAQALKNIAGEIYDMGVANGVNPELVFIRADVEGYSPGASKNNYWGLGCTNTGGYNACLSYGSVQAGVAGFLKNISQYNTLTDLTGKYAYLGDYWYNPGSASIGGCYYAQYIYPDGIPSRVQEACASGKSCTKSGGGSCVATTEEDKHAYLVYQSRTMVSARKRIFNLDSDSCATNTTIGQPGNGSCTIWKQGDPRWGSLKLGKSSETMARSGCAVTSLAIAMSCSGTTINNVATFNPGTFLQQLNATNSFTPGGAISWSSSAITSFAPLFRFNSSHSLAGSEQDKLNKVTNALNSNSGHTTILLHFVNDKHQRGHWVVLKSVSGTSITVYDPAGNEPDVNIYQARHLDAMRVYNF